MRVRAKFLCRKVDEYPTNTNVTLSAVTSQEGDNKDFADATPGGEISLMISAGRPAIGVFKPGHEYYADVARSHQGKVMFSREATT